MRPLRRSTGEAATSRGGKAIRPSSAAAGELSLVGGPRIGERGGDATLSSVGNSKLLDQRLNKRGRRLHPATHLVNETTMYAVCTLHSKHATTERRRYSSRNPLYFPIPTVAPYEDVVPGRELGECSGGFLSWCTQGRIYDCGALGQGIFFPGEGGGGRFAKLHLVGALFGGGPWAA